MYYGICSLSTITVKEWTAASCRQQVARVVVSVPDLKKISMTAADAAVVRHGARNATMFPSFLQRARRVARSGPDRVGIAAVADGVTILETCPALPAHSPLL